MKNNQASVLSSLRALPRPVWILFFGTFLNKFGAFVIPFLTLYLTGHGYSLGEAGLAISAYGVGNLVASILGGHLADHFGRRKTIVLSMFSAAAVMMSLSFAHGLAAIIALTGLAGLTGELYRPASSALLADLIGTEQRVVVYSGYRIAFNAGWALGPATAGFLAGHGFFWLFAGDAATSALFGLVALFALPKTRHQGAGDASWGESWRVISRDRQLHRVLLATVCVGVVFFQMASTLGLHIVHLGFSEKIYGFVLSFNGALVVLCELPLTSLTRRFPARSVMAVGYALAGIGFGLNAIAHSIAGLALGMAVFTLGEMISMPVAVAYVADLAPAHMRGRYMGTYVMVWAIAFMVGPAMGLQLYALGSSALWLVCGASGLLAAVIIRSGGEKAGKAEPAYCGASV